MENARERDLKNSTLAADIRKIRLLLLTFATILIWLAFDLVLTDGFVLTPRNLTSLSVQMTVTCILAIGMTWLLVAREIDLSAGAVMALVIIVIFQLQVVYEVGTFITLIVAFATGILLGLINGSIRIVLLVPSFVVTLAGFSWIRGMAFIVSEGQTHAGASESFYLISNSYLPPVYSVVLILLAGGYFTFKALWQILPGQPKLPISRLLDWLQLLVILGATIGSTLVFYIYRGLPFPVVILLILILVANWISTNTTFGRYIYALGGNPMAARRVGISISLMTIGLFSLMGAFTALAGVIQASLLDAGPPGIGQLLALNAISAAIIGGTSLFGGYGSIWGTVIGSLMMASIANCLSLAGVNTFYQMVATGIILIITIAVDSLVMNRGKGA
jgi:D-xylose transport system permease protein